MTGLAMQNCHHHNHHNNHPNHDNHINQENKDNHVIKDNPDNQDHNQSGEQVVTGLAMQQSWRRAAGKEVKLASLSSL